MDIVHQELTYTVGVGPRKGEILLRELDLRTLEDLLYYFPFRYIDRSKVYKVCEISQSQTYVQLRGRVDGVQLVGTGTGRRLIGIFSDETGSIDLVWFKGIKFMQNKFKPNEEYLVFGRPNVFNGRYNLPHPEVEGIDKGLQLTGGLMAYYNTTERMKSGFLDTRNLQRLIASILNYYTVPFDECLTPEVVEAARVISLDQALHWIHLPANPMEIRQAEYRLKFEELFYIQLSLFRYAQKNTNALGGFVFERIGDAFNRFFHEVLPFDLTNAQKRVLREVREDLRSGGQMNRLVQGDVGSGKTIVALMTMLMAIDNGFQACMMAPTEILATQHYESVCFLLEPLGLRCELLTGSTRKKERQRILSDLASGAIAIIIGTHALLEDPVVFHNLGIAIIDEQHRFGVIQRARLWTKNRIPPHILVMTATPIPRTLAMTLYGDLDVSVIDELPPGRKPIQTIHTYDNRRKSLYESIHRQIQLGRQVYIVYPLIEESERLDFKNLTDGFDTICQVFPDYRVAMVHGKMKSVEKEDQMGRFKRGEAQILVATTVIEVGVNVPNASVMVIESAERFGLSQLHQLRGRVGRGADQSYCILVTKYELADQTRRRMDIMVESNDGFVIAEADLRLRGPGDLEGLRQSGTGFNLRIADLAKDGQILQFARDVAEGIIKEDPTLSFEKNRVLRTRLEQLRATKEDYSRIS